MTESGARDTMFKMLAAAWAAGAGAVVGGAAPDILWQGDEKDAPPTPDKSYARATVLHNDGRQRSLAGAGGARLYERTGIVIVQCFGHLSSGKGLTIAEGLAKIAQNAFEGKHSPDGSIWFRNCRSIEVGPSGGWYQLNMMAPFTYSEVR